MCRRSFAASSRGRSARFCPRRTKKRKLPPSCTTPLFHRPSFPHTLALLFSPLAFFYSQIYLSPFFVPCRFPPPSRSYSLVCATVANPHPTDHGHFCLTPPPMREVLQS
jgi:hypothetical protein